MTKAYFISDVHLSEPDNQRWSQCLSFLKSLNGENATHLFLVGDIFDLWIADHNYFKEKFKVFIDEITRLKKTGVEIHFFEGNHDLYLKNYWSDELGLQIHSGPERFELAGLQVRVEHGDEMDPTDHGYIFLRYFLRTPVIRFINEKMPEKLIVKIGQKASEKSRSYTSNVKTIDAEAAIENIRVHAENAFMNRPFDLIISGHIHVKDDYEIDMGTKKMRSVNLGSWFKDPHVFFISEQEQKFIPIK